MDIFGESALEREGALAAAHGQSWQSTPFLHKHNMPQAAGESRGGWSRRHDAWQRGFEGYSRLDPRFAPRCGDRFSAQVIKEAHAVPVPSQPCSTVREAGTAMDMAVQTASPLDEQRLRTEPGIRPMGWRCEYRGYRHDRPPGENICRCSGHTQRRGA